MKLTKQFAAARGLRGRKFFSTGSCTSDLRSATSSRGVASPSVIRLVSRSRSRMPLSSLRISPRTTVLLHEVPDALRRASMASLSMSGRRTQERKEARAHAGHGGVKRGDQSCRSSRAAGVFGEDGSEQLQVADGHGIEDESVVLLVVADAVEMPQCFDAGGIRVFKFVGAERSPRAAFSRR